MVNNQLLNGMILQVGEQMEEQTHLIRLKFKGLGSNPPPPSTVYDSDILGSKTWLH